jgi:glutathione synthase/RimK-type ligase-like ATP-grasp enzyme
MASGGAKALAAALGVKRVRREGASLSLLETVINWGNSSLPRLKACRQLVNGPAGVRAASNKLTAFKNFKGVVSTPEWTETDEEAATWLAAGVTVVCRTILNGHSGEGIIICKGDDILPAAPLYTAYVKKAQEYRIHVHAGEVFFVQRKARDKGVPDDQVNWQVRNHQNGFIYANKDVDVDDQAKKQAIIACDNLGLDFGAVDIILGSDAVFYVLEVNTAPGLAGTTLDKYVEQFRRYV